MSGLVKLGRREFLRLGGIAGGGLVLGVAAGSEAVEAVGSWLAEEADGAELNAFVQVDPEGVVSIWVAKVDMGQGVRTSLPMLVADELDVEWEGIRVVQADAHPDRYGRQMTVGSSSIRRGAWMQLRQAGAAAREMLVAAAAARWGVEPSTCATEAGQVIHPPTDRRVSYGDVAEEAAALPVPEEPRLKDASELRIVGEPMPTLDTPAKVRGEAGFGMDVRVPDLLFATVVHCPVFGGSLAGFDDSEARGVTGVRDVFEISRGVAVVADNTWAAFQGARALDVEWDEGDFSMDSAAISARLAEVAGSPGTPARSEGDAAAGLERAARRVEAVYEAPYLAHATMEPMNCTAHVRADGCEVWAPTQNPQGTQRTAAELTGLAVEQVTVHPTLLGCGLGRRGSTDFVVDAVEVAMQAGVPVQTVWTREEDMRHDFYRPAAHVRFEGGVDENGRVSGVVARVVAQPLGADGGRGRDGVDRNAVDGLVSMPYAVDDLLVEYANPGIATPTGYWRSVGPSQNVFFVESFVDELADAAGRDPLEFRLEMLEGQPRVRHALELAADRAGWGTAPPAGRARGIGLVIDKGGHVAEIAEVSVQDGGVRVHRVTCAVDCGFIVNPNMVEAQTVGCVVNGLAAALYGEITLRGGSVVQTNFHNYPLLAFDEMPEVDVHLIDSDEDPGGAGEPPLPPVAPAVTNALFALTGTRIRRLPISRHDL